MLKFIGRENYCIFVCRKDENVEQHIYPVVTDNTCTFAQWEIRKK